MLKLLILQRLQYQVTDRLSFMRFLGIQLKSGQIIDATFVPVPIQRNGREDNVLVKADAVPVEWSKTPAKLAQKDIDARWIKNGGQNHYGYKNHINIDRDTNLITAHVHDSQVLDTILRDKDAGGKEVLADSAYRPDEQGKRLAEEKYESRIRERAYRNTPLSDAQEQSNQAKSRVRVRVEHVFGEMENGMGGIFLNSIGMARARVGVGLMNLVYNLTRIEVLIRQKVFKIARVGAPEVRGAA